MGRIMAGQAFAGVLGAFAAFIVGAYLAIPRPAAIDTVSHPFTCAAGQYQLSIGGLCLGEGDRLVIQSGYSCDEHGAGVEFRTRPEPAR